MRRLLLIAALLLAPSAWGQIAFDGTANSSAEDGLDVTSTTFSHTVTSNTNGIIVVFCGVTDTVEADRTISSITYAGTGLTKILQGAVDTIHAEMWRLVAPATGANNVVVTYGGTVSWTTCASVSLTGVDQTTPVDVSDDFFANNAAPSITLTTTVADAWIIDGINFNNFSTSFTMDAASGRTERWNFALSAAIRTGGSTRSTTTAGNYTNAWTAGTAAAFNYLAVAFKPTAAPAAQSGSRRSFGFKK